MEVIGCDGSPGDEASRATAALRTATASDRQGDGPGRRPWAGTVTPVKFLASEIAHAVGGALVGPDVEVRGAAIDSRLVRPGQLFVPVAGERDGHDFIAAARDAGAVGHPHLPCARGRHHVDRGGRHGRRLHHPRRLRPHPARRAGRRHHRLGRQDLDQGPHRRRPSGASTW